MWTAPAKIRGAQDWHDEIGRALARCDWFVVALTRRSVKRPWVRRELLYALHETRYHGRIVPLLFQKCAVEELSWTLRSSMQIIDFTADAAQAGRDVLKIWGLHDTQ